MDCWVMGVGLKALHFLGPRANAELVPKFHVALYDSHAALPMVISKFSPNEAR
jgi:hypothetical protein